MAKRLEEILDSCLNAIKKGKSIEYCLLLYPEHTQELEPLLKLALEIDEIPKPEPRKEAINVMLMKIGEAVVEQSEQEPVLGKFFSRPFLSKPVLVKSLATMLIAIVAVWSMGMVSSRSIPGDILYPIKTTTERVKFTLTRNTEGRAELRLAFADRRLYELLKVLEKRGTLDEYALKALLRETALALDEAQTIDENEFNLFLAHLDHFNNYTEDILNQMKPRISEHECRAVDKAIRVCQSRSKCMMEMKHRRGKNGESRQWKSGCRWK
ncbi:MAG: hypothetical protein E3J78_07390 [Candidatus Cloacimonadota bacterium]|nr:MAG: hypothetical protein E3J78_07390 [Candidatus Cloacimonadota bacterium]